MKPDRVVVLGAGPAGSAAAITLAAHGVEVTTIDPRPALTWEPGEGLPAAAGAALRQLGVWPSFQAGGHLRCGGFLSVWGSAEPAFRPALLDPRGPSWQLDRPTFNRMLRSAAGPVRPDRLTGVQWNDPGWTVSFAESPPLEADFLIDATGRAGALARLLGVPRRVDSRLVGIAALVDDPSPASSETIVEAVPQGWWYASRVPGGLAVSLFTDAAERLTAPARWSELLAATSHVGPRAAFPKNPDLRVSAAGSSSLERCAGRGWAAVGDAACAHDPLSSRGLHDALTGAITLGEALALGDFFISPYAGQLAHDYRRYLDDLAWFYRQETRFPESAFWRARQA
ncbi:NAD(P)/FAD-dependent oxidoreductase [Paractinoplanes globisporus]|uniref:NAD(P)/FAD-dependent oxidoreductase n=1 Tax=Paractinoplanes globisporus TaxID=113565 RepID=A0ABW6WFR3_9ACTN|nr:tryptophan 7-halogenase [Actinoplanes globisporus]